MLVPILIAANIPVYLFLGWLAFDSKGNAADTFLETMAGVVKVILIPRIVRVMLDMDTDGSWGLVPIAAYLAACVGIVYGEYALILKWFGGQ